MKISKRTIEILKNYASINPSIFIDERNVIKTRSLAGNIIAVADVEEELWDFGIFNLTELLNMISLFDIEETDFIDEGNIMVIKNGRRRFKYKYTQSDRLPVYGKIKPSEHYKAFSEWDASFNFSEDDLISCKKSASIMKLDLISISMNEGNGIFKVMKDDGDVNKFDIEIEGSGKCDIKFSVKNMIFLPGNYRVDICDKKLVKFTRDCNKIFYLLAPKK